MPENGLMELNDQWEGGEVCWGGILVMTCA